MMEPLFWLGLSILLVAVSLTALLVTAIPAFQELAKAGRSVQKLADTLSRELPPTLEAIRLTGLEISELSDELNQGAKNAGEAVKQVNESIKGAKKQAENVSVTTRSALAGLKAGWRAFSRPKRKNSAKQQYIEKSDTTTTTNSSENSPAVNQFDHDEVIDTTARED